MKDKSLILVKEKLGDCLYLFQGEQKQEILDLSLTHYFRVSRGVVLIELNYLLAYRVKVKADGNFKVRKTTLPF